MHPSRRTDICLTLNRKALFADREHLTELLRTIVETVPDVPVIAPLRNQAREVVEEMNLGINVVQPLSYLEFGWLSAHAKAIITDSGNVAEEATFNMIPCITLNSYTEHKETVTVGSNVLVDGDATKLRESLQLLMEGKWKTCELPNRWDGRTAERIMHVLLG